MRDITATVESIPLITASIVSKKAAEGLSSLILDVKVGKAAFMKTREQARELARSMVDAGNGAGVRTKAVLTAMENPIGRMIGNSLEVVESVQTLRGNGPADLVELVVLEGGHLLATNGNAETPEAGMQRIRDVLSNGQALACFQKMVALQGAGLEVAEKLCSDPWSVLPSAPHKTPVPAQSSGYITAIDAMALALVASSLGAGRARADDVLNMEVGIQLIQQVGEAVTEGEPWLIVHHNTPEKLSDESIVALRDACTIGTEKPAPSSRLLEVVE